MFRNGAWSMDRKYETRSVVDGHYISIVRSDYMDTGGAHPNSNVNTILWDSAASKRISIRPFFTETADDGPTMKAMVKAVLALADDREEEARHRRYRDRRMVQRCRAKAAQDRRGDAGAVDRCRARAPA